MCVPRYQSIAWRFVLFALFAGSASVAGAAGFDLRHQGIDTMGAAFAGSAVTTNDPSVMSYNPAGLTQLDGTQASGAFVLIDGRADFDGQGTYGVTGAPVQGGDGGNPGGLQGVPSLFVSHRLSSRAAIGIGFYVPFGQITNYDNGWTGRYQADVSRIEAFNINPIFAFKPTSSLSIGAGPIVQYFYAKLTNKVDAGSLAALGAYQTQQQLAAQGQAPAPTPQQLSGALGATQGQFDVNNDLYGSDVTLGFNVGLLWQPTDSTRVGLSYRSDTTPHINGKAERSSLDEAGLGNALSTFFGPQLGVGVAQNVDAQLSSTGANTHVALPATVDFGIRQAVTDRLALLGGIEWVGWNRLDKLVIRYDNGASSSTVPLKYDNTYRFAGGAEFRVNPTWTVRGGVAFDESPVDSKTRDARLPDSDRLILALGASVHATDNLAFDLAYQHLFFHDASINETTTTGSGNTLRGEYKIAADLIGVQANYRF